MPSSIRSLPGIRVPFVRKNRRVLGPICALFLLTVLTAVPAQAQSLRGSRASMDRQNAQARAHDYTFLANSGQVYRFVERGYLVRIPGNGDYQLKGGVSFPYARPEVKLFLERLGAQYRAACGERLVVTSLTRPKNRQPRNASPRSVHPTGMALDLRVPQNGRCRSWIERTFLSLEASGVLEANREYYPPHYHVALFPRPYTRYVEGLDGETDPIVVATGPSGRTAIVQASGGGAPVATRYTVRRGDTLWRIAQNHGVSVSRLKAVNAIRSSRIKPGQVLSIPAR
jgi:hypothetical protein